MDKQTTERTRTVVYSCVTIGIFLTVLVLCASQMGGCSTIEGLAKDVSTMSQATREAMNK